MRRGRGCGTELAALRPRPRTDADGHDPALAGKNSLDQLYMLEYQMEESISGFKEHGGWNDVVEHGERLTHVLGEFDVDTEAFAEWNGWRPKSHECLREDVNEKTAAQVSVDEGDGERAGRGPDEDLKSAGKKLSESSAQLDDPDEMMDSWDESIEYVARAADSTGRKAIRTVENTA